MCASARSKNSNFRRGSATYVCLNCKKTTRETGSGESGCELCRECFEIASYENQHTDSHTGAMKDCEECAVALYPIRVTAASWADNGGEAQKLNRDDYADEASYQKNVALIKKIFAK